MNRISIAATRARLVATVAVAALAGVLAWADEPRGAAGATPDAPAAGNAAAPESRTEAAPPAAALQAPAPPSVAPIPAQVPIGQGNVGVPGVARTPESNKWHMRYSQVLKRNWGIELETVRPVSSGYMLEMRYRVLDADKAMPLMEKKAKPYLIDEATGTRLMVPAMENIGELRQTPRPTEGRLYYIIFGNPGKLVKRGGLVTVVIGNFRAEGLVVD